MKDTNNVLDYNVWSAGDYDNSLTNVQCVQDNQKIIISNDWSVNGENSFKITRGGGTSYNWCRLRYPDNTPGRTLTCTIDCVLRDYLYLSQKSFFYFVRVYNKKKVIFKKS